LARLLEIISILVSSFKDPLEASSIPLIIFLLLFKVGN
jgi:hypothetical protein